MALNEAVSSGAFALAVQINKASGQDFRQQAKFAPNGNIGLLYCSSDRKGLQFHMSGDSVEKIDYWKHVKFGSDGYPSTPDKTIKAAGFGGEELAKAVQSLIGGISEADENGGEENPEAPVQPESSGGPPIGAGEQSSYGTTQEESKAKAIESENSQREVEPEFLKEMIQTKLRMMRANAFDGLLIFGDPGIGKTFPVEKFLKDNNIKFEPFSGSITLAGLFMALWENRKPHQWLFFDDIDSVFSDESKRNLLKAALGSARNTRYISYKTRTASFSSVGMSDEQMEKAVADSGNKKYPDKFLYRGKIIFISNLKSSQIEPAILSRTNKVNYELTPAQIWDLTESLLDKFDIEFQKDPNKKETTKVPLELRKLVLEMMKKKWKLKEKPNFRVFMTCCLTFAFVFNESGDANKAAELAMVEIGGM